MLFCDYFSDKEDCYFTSVLSTLKNEQPIFISTDNSVAKADNESKCQQLCVTDENNDCYGYIYNSSEKNCSTYKFMDIYNENINETVNNPSTELKHKGRYM